MTAKKQLDFKSENFFPKFSVTTNLVTSVKFNPIHCATIICHFGLTWKGSEANLFILLSRTVTNSAKGGYVVVLEHFAQNDELPRRKENDPRASLNLIPKSYLINAANS